MSEQTLPIENPTYAYVYAFVNELSRAGYGCFDVVICPGSRSTPLGMVFAAHPHIRTWMHVDERSAAFFALGMAKKSGHPVGLVCTSGTAAANFLPAIVEAHMSHVPLIVMTADRPPELRDSGAPQAIDQNRLYGTYAKWFVEVALPEATNSAMRYIRTIADRAVAQSQSVPAGPVHLNFPFREPLTPDPIPDQPLPPLEQRDTIAWEGREKNKPYTTIHDTYLAAPSDAIITNLADQICHKERGIIIVGPQNNQALAQAVIELAKYTRYPVLADPLSQLRDKKDEDSLLCTSYDAFLHIEDIVQDLEPDIVLRFGAMPTSKPLLLYLKHYPDCPQIIIDGNGVWEEPTQLASEMLHTDPIALCTGLSYILRGNGYRKGAQTYWAGRWQHIEHRTRETLQHAISDYTQLFEGRVFTELANMLPDNTTLFAGNSMPVRDMDTFFWSADTERRIQTIGNRGANGIDGVISTALGVSAASRKEEPTVLVIGDLSFFHDMNGLLAARLHNLNLSIILINNNGGGIFSFLPQADHSEHFEQLFGTPTDLDFSLAARMYGASFQRIESWEQFRVAISHSIKEGGLNIVEVPTERESNVKMHRQLWQAVDKALAQEHSASGAGESE